LNRDLREGELQRGGPPPASAPDSAADRRTHDA
jgi:hypothetical protein